MKTTILANHNKEGKGKKKPEKKSDAQCNGSPSADQCWTLLPKLRSTTLLGNSPLYKPGIRLCGAIPLLSLVHLFWLCSLPGFFVHLLTGRCTKETQRRKTILDLGWTQLSKTQNISVLSTPFSLPTQKHSIVPATEKK